MAKHTQVTVGTSAVVVVPASSASPANPIDVLVHNTNATQVLYLGGDNTVTTSNGMPVPASTTQRFTLTSGAAVYGIASALGTDIRVLMGRA